QRIGPILRNSDATEDSLRASSSLARLTFPPPQSQRSPLTILSHRAHLILRNAHLLGLDDDVGGNRHLRCLGGLRIEVVDELPEFGQTVGADFGDDVLGKLIDHAHISTTARAPRPAAVDDMQSRMAILSHIPYRE